MIRKHFAALALTFAAAFAIGYGLLVLAPPHIIRAALAGSETAPLATLSFDLTMAKITLAEKNPAERERFLSVMRAAGKDTAAWEDYDTTLERYERAAIRDLRERMHDPASFQLARVSRPEPGKLCIQYRARNGFGALRLADAFIDGSIIHTSELGAFGPHVFDRYLKHCVSADTTDITVLRAERAYLARPERIEAIARKVGLLPTDPDQYKAPPTR